MAGATVDIGTGAILTLGTSTTFDDLELLDVQWGGISRESIPTSHMGTTGTVGGHTFMPGDLADPGEVTLTFHFDPDVSPPINTAAQSLKVTWPKVTGDTSAAWWQCTSAFMTSFDINCPLEEKMTCTATFKLSGDITITPAA